jgi:hypothetical protein
MASARRRHSSHSVWLLLLTAFAGRARRFEGEGDAIGAFKGDAAADSGGWLERGELKPIPTPFPSCESRVGERSFTSRSASSLLRCLSPAAAPAKKLSRLSQPSMNCAGRQRHVVCRRRTMRSEVHHLACESPSAARLAA